LDFLNGFAEYIEEKRQAWKVPGIAVAVVKDGEVIFSQGFGLRNVAENLPVTPETIFAIGSSSKAFTAASVAIGVDDGKLEWDKPVQTYLPAFKMKDDFASARMSARDLLCHRSGLPRHDLGWYNSEATREQLLERIQYLEPNRDFRTHFQYQNWMYMTAGYLAGYVQGTSWEAVVRERIFAPLGMTSSQFSVDESQSAPDFALPYDEKDGEVKQIPFRNITTVGPAGSINSNVVDMIKWVQLQLDGGKLGEQVIFSEASAKQLHSQQMVCNDPLWGEVFGGNPVSYGLGWFMNPFRDQYLIHHGGNIDGFSALVSFMPALKTGMVVLTNLNGNSLTTTVTNTFYDRLLGGEGKDWHGYFMGFREKMKAQLEEAKSKSAADRVEGTQPSHALDAYVGEYEHPGYGVLKIAKAADGGLTLTYNRIDMALKHYHYDIFEATMESNEASFKLTFATDLKGNIGSLGIQLEPSVKDSIFTRMPDKSMANRAFLEPFVGKYEVMGMTLTIDLRGEDQLIASIPGQGDQTLVPYQGTTFNLKGLTGFSIEFKRDDSGAVTEAIITQPGATLSAKRLAE
jgi:CubicO group peptidase (beta-lactamase class C family)